MPLSDVSGQVRGASGAAAASLPYAHRHPVQHRQPAHGPEQKPCLDPAGKAPDPYSDIVDISLRATARKYENRNGSKTDQSADVSPVF